MCQVKVVEKTKTHIFMLNNVFSESRTFHAEVCDSGVEPDRQQMAIRRMRIAY